MELNDDALLEEGPGADFQGATLQIHQDSSLCSRSPSSLGDGDIVEKLSESADEAKISPGEAESRKVVGSLVDEKCLKPSVSSVVDAVSPITSIPKRISEKFKRTRSKSGMPVEKHIICQNPILEEDEAKDFFTYRDGLVENAVRDCISDLVIPDKDGEILGSWLLTEISLWDNEKERLILLTTQMLITVKYDFIALKKLEFQKVSLDLVDTLIIGDLVYPSGSLVPRLNGLTSGVVTVIKGCLLRPLQERWTQNKLDKDFCASAFDFVSFEPRSRNVRGLRAMWNKGKPLPFTKKWNPFSNDIPWTTYMSHPLLWRKESAVAAAAAAVAAAANEMYNIDDFTRNLISAVEKAQTINKAAPHCIIEHKPIVLENYVGIGSVIHNRNALGFFKVRGRFSF